MTNATSDFNESAKLDVDFGTVKRLLMEAYERYDQAFRDGDKGLQMYFDGMIRGLQYVIDAHDE